MSFLPLLALATLSTAASTFAGVDAVQSSVPECHEWRQCRDLALEARANGRYETFHDLAWRTMQTGPPNDPAIMYLLARAQSLSNRSRDALIMLTRLANMGIVTDAATEEDFRRTRELPGWTELEALIERVTNAKAAAPAVAPSRPAGSRPTAEALPPAPAPSAARPLVRSALKFDPRPVEAVARFSAEPFVPGGLAYDAVSRRFLFGDMLGRKLIVVGEGLDRAVDLVRAEAARFHDVTALEIDAKRGDLWVASTARNSDVGAIHKLQLSSGRLIAMFELSPETAAVRLTDLTIGASGTVLVLDSATPRVLGLRSGMNSVERLMPLNVAAPASIAMADEGRTAYVAHRDGIVRLDLQRQTAVPVRARDGIELGNFERIRWHRHSLVGVEILPDGRRQIVHLQLNRGGEAVTDASLIDASLGSDGGPTFATVSADDVYYLVTQQRDAIAPRAGVMNVLVQRIRLP